MDEVRMTIIQPKLALRGGTPITTWTVPVSELLTKISVLVDQARATDNPDAPLIPGDSQCKYCRAKGACSALAGNVMKEVGIMFQPIADQTFEIAQQSADRDPAVMSDDQIRQVMEAAPLMRQLLEAVEKKPCVVWRQVSQSPVSSWSMVVAPALGRCPRRRWPRSW
jgi:hypothetical protein